MEPTLTKRQRETLYGVLAEEKIPTPCPRGDAYASVIDVWSNRVAYRTLRRLGLSFKDASVAADSGGTINSRVLAGVCGG